MSVRHKGPAVMLHGPKVQYASGEVAAPQPFDLEDVLAGYARLSAEKRRAFLSILAHSLTVDMRVALIDRPISAEDTDRAWQLNEWLHHLTSCFDPGAAWGAEAESELIRSMATGSFRLGLDTAIGRAVATAAGNTMAPVKKKLAAATAN